MSTINLLKKLERYPLFTENDVSKLINKSPDYVKTYLYRLHKKGIITRIEKGKYTLHSDPLIFSSYIAIPSYFSLWTALRFYNMTQQQPIDLFLMSAKKRRDIALPGMKIRFIKTRHMFGYTKIRYTDFDIFIAEKEKAIIDSMLYKIPMADVHEALNDLNFQKLCEYTKRTKNASLIKRIGYLIEMRTGQDFGLKVMDNNYIKLDSQRKEKGIKNSKWKLWVNI